MKKVLLMTFGLVGMLSASLYAQSPQNDCLVAEAMGANGNPILESQVFDVGINDGSCNGCNWKFNVSQNPGLGLDDPSDGCQTSEICNTDGDNVFNPMQEYYNNMPAPLPGESDWAQKILTQTIEAWRWNGTSWVKVYELTMESSKGTMSIKVYDNLLMPDCLSAQYLMTNANGSTAQKAIVNINLVALGPLPVNYKAFNAQRNKSTAVLSWTTTQEQNNKGFEILRKMDGAGFQVVGYLPSKSLDGNSSIEISYDFSDPNMAKGVTQYQLRQIDKDGKSKLSDVRMVQGMEFGRKMLVYPNPSTSGNVSLQFSNTDAKDISVIDMSGRTLKRINGYTQAKLDLTGLVGGTYNVRIFNRTTNEMSVESFVIMRK